MSSHTVAILDRCGSGERPGGIGLPLLPSRRAACRRCSPRPRRRAEEMPARAGETWQVIVQITRLSPAVLDAADDIKVTGVVRNPERYAWTDVQVYPAVAKTPFHLAGAARAAITEWRDLHRRTHRGSERPRRPRHAAGWPVPPLLTDGSGEQLDLSGAEGVYPLGIHVLATGPGGVRTDTAVGRANTFLPLRTGTAQNPITRTPTTVLWPFLLPGERRSDNSYADTAELAASISPRGQTAQSARPRPDDTAARLGRHRRPEPAAGASGHERRVRRVRRRRDSAQERRRGSSTTSPISPTTTAAPPSGTTSPTSSRWPPRHRRQSSTRSSTRPPPAPWTRTTCPACASNGPRPGASTGRP